MADGRKWAPPSGYTGLYTYRKVNPAPLSFSLLGDRRDYGKDNSYIQHCTLGFEGTGGNMETRELKDFRAETEGQQPERAYTWHGTRLTASVRLTTDIPESRPCTERGISGWQGQAGHIAFQSNKGREGGKK